MVTIVVILLIIEVLVVVLYFNMKVNELKKHIQEECEALISQMENVIEKLTLPKDTEEFLRNLDKKIKDENGSGKRK